jgi:MFS family permease
MSESRRPAALPPSAVAGDAAPLADASVPAWRRGITRLVVALGIIALFTDMGSEMIMPLRLIFFVQALGTPLLVAGTVEGVAEAATSVLKLTAGRLADQAHQRNRLVIAGYTISNLSKPLLALASSWPLALGLVLTDRSGKALRSSPRDAMIAAAVPPELHGKAFGFHRSADTLGAAIGPLLALVILAADGHQLRPVFAWTLAPGLVAILCALLFLGRARRAPAVAEPMAVAAPATVPPSAAPAEPAWRGLGARFWLFAVIATVFALGNSSDAFIFLRTEGLEASLLAVPAVYLTLNLVYMLLATPLGSLSDRFGRLPILALGYATFAVVYFGWMFATAGWHVWALFLLYGAYYAATEGVARAFVVELVPKARRGTALGWFGALTGLAALPANVLAAALWSRFGPGLPFGMGALLGAIALGLLLAWWPWLRRTPVPWPEDPPARAMESRP